MLHLNVRKINAGFTLIEMLTVIIIVGVIAAIAAPNFLGMLNRNRLKQGQSQVEGAMKEAQRLALRMGKICKIQFTTVDSQVVVEVDPDTAYNGCLLNSRTLPSGVAAGTVDGTAIDSTAIVSVAFSPKGNTDSGNTQFIRLSHPTVTGTDKCVAVSGILGGIKSGTYQAASAAGVDPVVPVSCVPD